MVVDPDDRGPRIGLASQIVEAVLDRTGERTAPTRKPAGLTPQSVRRVGGFRVGGDGRRRRRVRPDIDAISFGNTLVANASVTATPEPSTFVLLCAGVAAILRRKPLPSGRGSVTR